MFCKTAEKVCRYVVEHTDTRQKQSFRKIEANKERFAAHKTTVPVVLNMVPTFSKLLFGLLVMATPSVEAFHPRSIVGGDEVDVVEFARARVVGRKREAGDVDAEAPLEADAPVDSPRRNEEEGSNNKGSEGPDVGGGRGFPTSHHIESLPTSPLFYGHH